MSGLLWHTGLEAAKGSEEFK